MNVLVLDDTRKKTDAIREVFSNKKINATVCATTNEFMAAVTSKFDSVYINVETWKKGRCVYEYFAVGSKFENKPAVFYNADENFAQITGRAPNEHDRIIHMPSDIETALLEAV